MGMTVPEMWKIIPEGSIGDFKIEHFDVSKEAADLFNFRSFGRYKIYPGKYCRLTYKNQVVMSDTNHEKSTNSTVLNYAQGQVLIGGLGIGMVLCGICQLPEVVSVTIVEVSPEVIELVWKNLPDYVKEKTRVVNESIFDFRPPKGTKYDTIYFDIWNDITTDNLPEMFKLHQRFKSFRNRDNKNSWMDSWCRDELRYMKLQEKRSIWYR